MWRGGGRRAARRRGVGEAGRRTLFVGLLWGTCLLDSLLLGEKGKVNL